MKCLNPRKAYLVGNRPAKDGIVSPNLIFSPSKAAMYAFEHGCDIKEIALPCGKCDACRLVKLRDWTTRLSNEASLYDQSCFLTLTYNNDNLPYRNASLGVTIKPYDYPNIRLDKNWCPSLFVRDVQLFLKRLRKCLSADEIHVRFFASGEYGSKTHRPHYHLLVFGWFPEDVQLLKTHNGFPIFRSRIIEELWPYGFSSVSTVSANVARYVGRYVSKKIGLPSKPSKGALDEFFIQSTGEGAIGKPWFDLYGKDACKNNVVHYKCCDNVLSAPLPKYYVKLLRKFHRDEFLDFRKARRDYALNHENDFDLDAVKRWVDKQSLDSSRRTQYEVF